MDRPRPHGINATDQFLGLLLDEMEAQGEVLQRILDRLPKPTVVSKPIVVRQPDSAPGPVEVSEPAPKLAPGRQAGTEPEAVSASEPAPKVAPVKKAAPRKSTARRRT